MGSFLPVTLEDKEKITGFLRLYPNNEASEFSFTNLYIWSGAEHVEWLDGGGFMILRTRPGGVPRYLMTFAPEDRLETALETAIASARAEGVPFSMHSLPEWYCDILRARFPERFVFARESHLDDYVYHAADLIRLSGKKYQAKRNHINKFMNVYGRRFVYVPFTADMATSCMEVYDQWLSVHQDAVGLMGERDSVLRALYHAEDLGLAGGVILVDGRPEAFSLGERFAPDMAVIHIEKANIVIPELFALINREFAAHAFSDLLWINREEDMGKDGLRQAKQSYHPARMIEKYCAALREDQ